MPTDARFCLEMLAAQLRIVKEQILENDRRILASARETELGRRLMEIPGVGPLLASAIVATVPDPAIFRSGRNLAAWIGLVPRQNSSGGKERLGGITKAGHQYLRQMLIVGAMAVVRYAERNGAKRPWLVQLLARRKTKVAAVALANKNARMIWAMMVSGERYREPRKEHGAGDREVLPEFAKTGPVYHVSIIRLHFEGLPFNGVLQHAPFSQAVLNASVTHLSTSKASFPDANGGIDQWRQAQGGVFTITVAEAVNFAEQTMRKQMPTERTGS